MPPAKIIKSGRRGEVKGEIKTSSREVRLSALKGLEALPASTRVGVIYSLLYDADTRVRAVARKELLTLPTELISAYIAESGHPKVLDFIVRNLPKNSPLMPIIAGAPNLQRRSKQFLMAQGIEAAPAQAAPVKSDLPPPLGIKKAPSPDDNKKLEVDLEWRPGMEDFELPEGVNIDIPVDDEEDEKPIEQLAVKVAEKPIEKPVEKPVEKPSHKKAVDLDQLDTKPALPPIETPAPPPKPAPEAKVPVQPKREVAQMLAQLKTVKIPVTPPPSEKSDPFKPDIVEKFSPKPNNEPEWKPFLSPQPMPKPATPQHAAPPPPPPPPPPTPPPPAPIPPPPQAAAPVVPPPKKEIKPEPVKQAPTPPPIVAPKPAPPPEPKPEPVVSNPLEFMFPISPDPDMDEVKKKRSVVPLPVADGDLDDSDEYSTDDFYPPKTPEPVVVAPPPPPPPPPPKPEPKKKEPPQRSATPPPPPAPVQAESMFPVADREASAFAPIPVDATPNYPTYQHAESSSRRSTFATGLFAGLIIVLAITAAVYAVVKFYPKNKAAVVDQPVVEEPADPEDTDENPVDVVQPTTQTPPVAAGVVDIYLGTYKNLSGLRKAQKKAEDLGFITSYTQKEDEQTTYGVSCGSAPGREAAQRKAAGIKSLGIPASVSCNADDTRCSLFCGSLSSKDAAEKRSIALRASGYGGGISERKKKVTQYTLRAKDVPADKKDEMMKLLSENGFKPRVF